MFKKLFKAIRRPANSAEVESKVEQLQLELNSYASDTLENNCKHEPLMPPDEIETTVLHIWHEMCERWSPPENHEVWHSSPYAQFLSNSDSNRGYFFYIPAVKKYYHVEIYGNYYHGYATDIDVVDKEFIIKKLQVIASRVGLDTKTPTCLETGKTFQCDNGVQINNISWGDLIERMRGFPE